MHLIKGDKDMVLILYLCVRPAETGQHVEISVQTALLPRRCLSTGVTQVLTPAWCKAAT